MPLCIAKGVSGSQRSVVQQLTEKIGLADANNPRRVPTVVAWVEPDKSQPESQSQSPKDARPEPPH